MRYCCLLLIVFSLAGCNDSDHAGYDRLWNSLHYKHIVLGEEDNAVADDLGAYVSFHVTVIDEKGDVVVSKLVERLPMVNIGAQGEGLSQALLSMRLNDSTSFRGGLKEMEFAKAFPHMADYHDSTIDFTVRVTELISDEAYRSFRAQERAMNDLEMLEMSVLSKVLDSLSMDDSNEFSGMYFKSLKEGRKAKPVSGTTVWVNYIGRFPSGKTFDNTYQGKMALEYQIGKPDQVIPGFGIGVSQMREGGKALFVIPSNLGFGEKGSSSGIVPPYATLVYEVTLLRVGV